MTTRTGRLAAKLFSDQGLTKKAWLNSIAAGLDYTARFAVRFFVTPVVLAALGPTLFGIWEVVRKSTDYLSASGRASQALKWFVVDRQGSHDGVEKRQGVGGALSVTAMLAPLQILVGAVVAWYSPIWFSAPDDAYVAVRLCTAIVILGIVSRGFTDVSRCVLEGENLGYKRMWISTVLVALGGVLTVVAVRLGTGLVGLAAASVATTVLTGLAFLMVVKSFVPWFGIAWPTAKVMKQFAGLSGWFFAWFLIGRVMEASDVVVLGIFASPALVTTYSLIRFLPEATLRFVTVLVFETVPGLGKILARGDVARARATRGEIMILMWLATTVVGGTILLWNDAFVHLWIGESFSGGWLTTLLLILMMFQFVWFRVDADIINLDLRLIGVKVLLGFGSVVMSLGLGIVALRVYNAGINGLCVGFILGRLLLTLGYPWLVGKILDAPLGQQLRSSIRPGIVTLGTLGATSFGSQYLDLPTSVNTIGHALGWMALTENPQLSLAFQWLLLVMGAGMTFSCHSHFGRSARHQPATICAAHRAVSNGLFTANCNNNNDFATITTVGRFLARSAWRGSRTHHADTHGRFCYRRSPR